MFRARSTADISLLCFGAWVAYREEASARRVWLESVDEASQIAWRERRLRCALDLLREHKYEAFFLRSVLRQWSHVAVRQKVAGAMGNRTGLVRQTNFYREMTLFQRKSQAFGDWQRLVADEVFIRSFHHRQNVKILLLVLVSWSNWAKAHAQRTATTRTALQDALRGRRRVAFGQWREAVALIRWERQQNIVRSGNNDESLPCLDSMDSGKVRVSTMRLGKSLTVLMRKRKEYRSARLAKLAARCEMRCAWMAWAIDFVRHGVPCKHFQQRQDALQGHSACLQLIPVAARLQSRRRRKILRDHFLAWNGLSSRFEKEARKFWTRAIGGWAFSRWKFVHEQRRKARTVPDTKVGYQAAAAMERQLDRSMRVRQDRQQILQDRASRHRIEKARRRQNMVIETLKFTSSTNKTPLLDVGNTVNGSERLKEKSNKRTHSRSRERRHRVKWNASTRMEMSDLRFEDSHDSSDNDNRRITKTSSYDKVVAFSSSSSNYSDSEFDNELENRSLNLSEAKASAVASYYSSYAGLKRSSHYKKLQFLTKSRQLARSNAVSAKKKAKNTRKINMKRKQEWRQEEALRNSLAQENISISGISDTKYEIELASNVEKEQKRCIQEANDCYNSCFDRLRDPLSSRLPGMGTVTGEAIAKLLLRIGAFNKGWLGKSASFGTMYKAMQNAVGNDYDFGIQTVGMDRKAFHCFMHWIVQNACCRTIPAQITFHKDKPTFEMHKQDLLKVKEVLSAIKSDATTILGSQNCILRDGTFPESPATMSMDADENARPNTPRSQRNKRKRLDKFVLSRPDSECFPEPFESNIPVLFRMLSALIRQKFEKPLLRLFSGFSERQRDHTIHELSRTKKIKLPRILTWKGLQRFATAHNILENSSCGHSSRSIHSRLGGSRLNVYSELDTGITKRQLQKMHSRLITHRNLARVQRLQEDLSASTASSTQKQKGVKSNLKLNVDSREGISFGEFQVLCAQCAIIAPNLRSDEKPEQRIRSLMQIMGLKSL